VQMETIAGREPQRGSDVGRDHQPALLAHYHCGIHMPSVPHIVSLCHIGR